MDESESRVVGILKDLDNLAYNLAASALPRGSIGLKSTAQQMRLMQWFITSIRTGGGRNEMDLKPVLYRATKDHKEGNLIIASRYPNPPELDAWWQYVTKERYEHREAGAFRRLYLVDGEAYQDIETQRNLLHRIVADFICGVHSRVRIVPRQSHDLADYLCFYNDDSGCDVFFFHNGSLTRPTESCIRGELHSPLQFHNEMQAKHAMLNWLLCNFHHGWQSRCEVHDLAVLPGLYQDVRPHFPNDVLNPGLLKAHLPNNFTSYFANTCCDVWNEELMMPIRSRKELELENHLLWYSHLQFLKNC